MPDKLSTPTRARRARTERQRAQMDAITLAVYEFIRDYHRIHHVAPTVREIGEAVYHSHTTVYRHLDKLVGMGWVRRESNRPRSISLGENAPDYHAVKNAITGDDDDDESA